MGQVGSGDAIAVVADGEAECAVRARKITKVYLHLLAAVLDGVLQQVRDYVAKVHPICLDLHVGCFVNHHSHPLACRHVLPCNAFLQERSQTEPTQREGNLCGIANGNLAQTGEVSREVIQFVVRALEDGSPPFLVSHHPLVRHK